MEPETIADLKADLAYHERKSAMIRGQLGMAAPVIVNARLMTACLKLYQELDTLTGGDRNHPLANMVGFWKSYISEAITTADCGVTPPSCTDRSGT